MKVWTVESLGRNADRIIKQYEHVPAIITLVSFSLGILMLVILSYQVRSPVSIDSDTFRFLKSRGHFRCLVPALLG